MHHHSVPTLINHRPPPILASIDLELLYPIQQGTELSQRNINLGSSYATICGVSGLMSSSVLGLYSRVEDRPAISKRRVRFVVRVKLMHSPPKKIEPNGSTSLESWQVALPLFETFRMVASPY